MRKAEKTLGLSFVPREGLNLEDWEPMAWCASQWKSYGVDVLVLLIINTEAVRLY